jgi:hypothetical protein
VKTAEQIKKLGSIVKLTPKQIDRVLGFCLEGASECELQAGKERIIAFINRVQNDHPTQEDQEILAMAEESPCLS